MPQPDHLRKPETAAPGKVDEMAHLQRVIRELQWVYWETRFRPLAAWCEVMIECARGLLNSSAADSACAGQSQPFDAQ